MQPVRLALERFPEANLLVTGVGPVQAAMTVTKKLATSDNPFEGVINFGVGGAFVNAGLKLLDICLAHQEIIGDLGICLGEKIEPFEAANMTVPTVFKMRNSLLERAEALLQNEQTHYTSGNFVTVSCVSGTARRGNYLRDKHQAICENMEGAAIASVCQDLGVPFLELRCISNMVEDRDVSRWKLTEACQKSAEILATLCRGGLIG